MYRPDHAKHTATTAHHDDRVQFLVVGDESSLAQLEAELALLPLCARGRVFVEVESPDDVSVLATPLRMTVTWLPRARRSGRPGTGRSRCAKGVAATRAVRAWTTEMLCDGAGETRAIVTGGFALVSEVQEHLRDEVGMPADAVIAARSTSDRARRIRFQPTRAPSRPSARSHHGVDADQRLAERPEVAAELRVLGLAPHLAVRLQPVEVRAARSADRGVGRQHDQRRRPLLDRDAVAAARDGAAEPDERRRLAEVGRDRARVEREGVDSRCRSGAPRAR